MTALPVTGINGRPVAISPVMNYAQENPSDGGGGLLSSILCGGGDSPFLLCDGSPGGRANEVDFDVNPTGVFVAVQTKQWKLACERVKIYPREASTWVVRKESASSAAANASGVGVDSGNSSDRFDEPAAVASPRSGGGGGRPEPKVMKWRMLPLHAAVLFGAPVEVVKALLKAYPPACSAHDDKGMLPLHLAFRCGSSEEISLVLLDEYPEAIEREDFKGRLPSMLAPKVVMSYAESIGEAFLKGPSHYYWASRVATADRIRSETAMTKQIKQIEQNALVSDEQGKEMLQKTEKQLSMEINTLSIENVDLKERVAWFQNKYDGADEKEKVLVDHTNSLAERLRLTSLSEEHLATKLAKLEARLQNKEVELEQARSLASEEKEALGECVNELEKSLAKSKHKAESLKEKLEKKIMDSNEARLRFEKERKLFEKQIDASKACLMELIASSKEDKRLFEEDSRELRQQLASLQSEMQKSSLDEKRMMEEQLTAIQDEVKKAASVSISVSRDEQRLLEERLAALQDEVKKVASASSTRSAAEAAAAAAAAKAESRALEEKLDFLRKEVTDSNRSFMNHVNAAEAEDRSCQFSATRELQDRISRLQEEVDSARSYMGGHSVDGSYAGSAGDRDVILHYPRDEPQPSSEEKLSRVHDPRRHPRAEPRARKGERASQQYSYPSSSHGSFGQHSAASERSVRSSKRTQMRPLPSLDSDGGEDPFDTYVSTKSVGMDYQSRDDSESFSHQSDVSTALALGELDEDQRLALEQLDLSGSREEIEAMLRRVPGLTKNQVNLLVDVASSLAE